jgi:hypothetical protein
MSDQVLDQFDRIEEAAGKILEEAKEQKASLVKANDERMTAFDQKTDAAAAVRIDRLREKLQSQHEAELQKLKTETDRILARLETGYRARKEELADEIIKNMLT